MSLLCGGNPGRGCEVQALHGISRSIDAGKGFGGDRGEQRAVVLRNGFHCDDPLDGATFRAPFDMASSEIALGWQDRAHGDHRPTLLGDLCGVCCAGRDGRRGDEDVEWDAISSALNRGARRSSNGLQTDAAATGVLTKFYLLTRRGRFFLAGFCSGRGCFEIWTS